jgi:hypothetical protein
MAAKRIGRPREPTDSEAPENVDSSDDDDAAPFEVTDAMKQTSVELLTAAVVGGHEQTHDVAQSVPKDELGAMLMFCIPENWHNAASRNLCRRLSDDEAAICLAWMTDQWHAAYAIGQSDGANGVNLLEQIESAAMGDGPATETETDGSA